MKQKLCINMAKFIAILAVLIDHTNGVLYTSRNIAVFSYFSVSLFILVMGITSYWSYEKKYLQVWKKVLTKCFSILCSYALATFIYSLIAFRYFDFITYRNYFLNFNISGPFYYIFLYVQLTIISPIIFYFIKKCTMDSKIKSIVKFCIGGGLNIVY